VAFSGGVGTLKEVALCWNLVQTGSADPRPLVVVGDRWQALLDTLRERLILTRPEHLDLVHHVDDAESALPLLTG
jgi:predicted Rossmann-fold nucleotide-binding protein